MLVDIEEIAKKVDRINVSLMIILTELNILTGDKCGRIQFAKDILTAKYPLAKKDPNVIDSKEN